MKIVRVKRNDEMFYAVKDGCVLKRLAESPFSHFEVSGKRYFSGSDFTGEEIADSDMTLLPPCEPTKIVAVGLV